MEDLSTGLTERELRAQQAEKLVDFMDRIDAYNYIQGIRSHTETDSGSSLISPIKMEKELTDSDWDEIFSRYYQLKREHVEVLIDSFVKPDIYKCLDRSMNLKDYFLQEILKRLEKNKQ